MTRRTTPNPAAGGQQEIDPKVRTVVDREPGSRNPRDPLYPPDGGNRSVTIRSLNREFSRDLVFDPLLWKVYSHARE
jgi:hypothetical protein